MIYCSQFLMKEVRSMFRQNGSRLGMWCCRMLISRACSMAEAFGSFAAHLISAQR